MQISRTLRSLALLALTASFCFAQVQPASSGAAQNPPPSVPDASAPAQPARGPFYLKDGDRVCFYGDSITEQRFYPVEVQTYVLTRFPHLRIRYVDAAVGGDRVTGGWAGPIDLRLRRDVFPFHPDVVTIMLGMNDAAYQPFNQKIFDTYKTGYEHIIQSLQQHLPGVRIVLLQTSPFDEGGFTGGYNAVLGKYDEFVKSLADRYHLIDVDFNTPMNQLLNQTYQTHPQLAKKLFPGFIHPGPEMEMVMAQQLLQAWGAPATVSDVALTAQGKVLQQTNTRVSGFAAAHGRLQWRQLDNALPLPMLSLHEKWPQFPKWNIFMPPQPNPTYTNPVAALVDSMSGFTHNLDQERLRVEGLTAPRYRLEVDGNFIAEFSPSQLAGGVNLARYFTPMLWQAYHVQNLVWEEMQVHFEAWHGVQTSLGGFAWVPQPLPVTTENNPAAASEVDQVVRDMGRLQETIAGEELIANQPVLHQFRLIPETAAAIATATPAQPLGLFRHQLDVGHTLYPGKASFNGINGRYRLTGSGANIWASQDAFHFAYRRLSGNFVFTAKVKLSPFGNPHRKAVLMARQSLAPDSAYADAALHGVGLTSLQYRPLQGAQTKEVQSKVNAPAYLRLQRRGDQFTMSVSNDGKNWTTSGPVTLQLPQTVYLGLGVCAHDPFDQQTAVFSHVTLRPLP